ncbi:MAG: ATP-binding cassette domain-containing protein [Pseudomonadota bacterium]
MVPEPFVPQKPAIELRDLHKSFGRNHVLRGVNLEILAGQSLVVIGGSGSGKSLLLKCILGLEYPDHGDILIDGQSVLAMKPLAREQINKGIGMLFQYSALFDSLPVWENITFALLQERRLSRAQARNSAIERLQQVGLEARIADLSPAELSGGMRKRVGLARAVAKQPSILFFDEPTTGLDPITARRIDHLTRHIVQTRQATSVTITHDIASAKRIADRVAMIHEGQILWHGTVDEMAHSGNAYVDQFIHGALEGPIG